VVGTAVGGTVGIVDGVAVGDGPRHATSSWSVPDFRTLWKRASTSIVAPALRLVTWMGTRSLLVPHFLEAPEASSN